MKKMVLKTVQSKWVLIASVFYSSYAFAQPSINSVTGDVTEGASLTINGSAFTPKANPKPLFWWKADFGTSPSSLGRMAAWSDDDNLGSLSTTIVAPGSQQSFGTDHGSSSGIALSRVNFESDSLYLYRKTYEDFDITSDEALSTRINLISGTLKVGDVITGQTSGATGTIVAVKEAHPNITYMTHTLQYDNVNGTINAQPSIGFIKDEQMTSNAGAVMNSVQDLFRTFNFKTIRMRVNRIGNTYPRNNMHLNAQGAEGSAFRITPEYTEGTTWSGSFTNQRLYQLPREWKTEELQYKTSSIDNKDGVFNFYQKGILGTDNKFKMRNASEQNRYNSIVQSQVSHNAQPNSVMYYDSLYVDDTWHRVLICPESIWATRTNCEIQIPTSWNDNGITIQLNLGGLVSSSAPLYLYVIGADGVPNSNGWLLTASNPINNAEIPNDYDGDGKSDILWRHVVSNGNKLYLMNADSITTDTDISIFSTDPAWESILGGDFNNDDKADILWRHSTSGLNHISLMNGTATPTEADLAIPALVDTQWKISGIGDFDDDGNDDLFWHHDDGENRITFMNGTTESTTSVVNTISDPLWKVAGIADFDQDGRDDVLWRHSGNKRIWLYLMNGNVISNGGGSGEHVVFTSENWDVNGVGDFNADGKGDILWRHNLNGRVWMYFMNGKTITNQTVTNSVTSPGEHVAFTGLDWDIKAIGDYNGDGKQDIFWRNNVHGWNHMYLMNGATLSPTGGVGVNTLSDLNWKIRRR